MTSNNFRAIALALPGAVESEHMSHPDFRVGGKVFASLGYPDGTCGMVKLTPEQQRSFMEQAPKTFQPCNGAWGIRGCTNVHLESAKMQDVKAAVEAAFRNVGDKTGLRTGSMRPVKQKRARAKRPRQD